MVMSAEAASIEPGSLSGQTIYLALPDDLYAEVAAAFAHVAATLVQLDPAQGIPQRPERLQQLNATRDEADDW
jgi:hypothetical protein